MHTFLLEAPASKSYTINFQKIKQINEKIIKKNKIAHSCNFLKVSSFKRCVKEAVVAAVFMFEFNLFQIFGLRNDIFFCSLIGLGYDIFFCSLIVLQSGISNTICDLVLLLF